MKTKIKYGLIGGAGLVIVSVLGFGGWLILDVINERDFLQDRLNTVQHELEQCIEDQNELIELIEDREKEIEHIREVNERLEERIDDYENEIEEKEEELEEVLNKIEEEPIGEECEENMEFLRDYWQQ